MCKIVNKKYCNYCVVRTYLNYVTKFCDWLWNVWSSHLIPWRNCLPKKCKMWVYCESVVNSLHIYYVNAQYCTASLEWKRWFVSSTQPIVSYRALFRQKLITLTSTNFNLCTTSKYFSCDTKPFQPIWHIYRIGCNGDIQ